MSKSPYAIPGCELTPEAIIKEWEKHFKMKQETVTVKDSHPDVSIPRQILSFALFTYGSVSKTWIAGCMHRDRITIKNQIEAANGLLNNKEHKIKILSFIARLKDISGLPDDTYTIEVKLNREDFKRLLPDTNEWMLEHWSLKALWNLYTESRFDKRKKDGNMVRKNGITGKSTLYSTL